MVALYRYDRKIGAWVFFSYGLRAKVIEYTKKGYVAIYVW